MLFKKIISWSFFHKISFLWWLLLVVDFLSNIFSFCWDMIDISVEQSIVVDRLYKSWNTGCAHVFSVMILFIFYVIWKLRDLKTLEYISKAINYMEGSMQKSFLVSLCSLLAMLASQLKRDPQMEILCWWSDSVSVMTLYNAAQVTALPTSNV